MKKASCQLRKQSLVNAFRGNDGQKASRLLVNKLDESSDKSDRKKIHQKNRNIVQSGEIS